MILKTSLAVVLHLTGLQNNMSPLTSVKREDFGLRIGTYFSDSFFDTYSTFFDIFETAVCPLQQSPPSPQRLETTALKLFKVAFRSCLTVTTFTTNQRRKYK